MDAVVTAVPTDISRAWQAAQEQILAAGIDLHRAPLFLTLGQPAGGIEEFCTLLPLESPLPLPSRHEDAPLHVYGNQDGLFVFCNQTSVLGEYLGRLAADGFRATAPSAPSPLAASATVPNTDTDTDTPDSRPTLSDRVPEGAVGGILAGGPFADTVHPGPARVPHASPLGERPSGTTATLVSPTATGSMAAGSMTAGSMATGSMAAGSMTAGSMVAELLGTSSRVARPSASETVRSVERQWDELERQLALADAGLQSEPAVVVEAQSTASTASERFTQLCRLISAAREPYCPLNGVVVLLPLEILDHDETVEQGANGIQRDLQAMLQTLETEVSVQVVVCGLAACEGGDELLARLSEEQLYGTLGFALPTSSGGNREAARRSIARATWWLCEGLFPALACRVLRRDGVDEHRDRADLDGNRRLHALVGLLRGRRQRLSRLLVGSLAKSSGQWRLRGCFFAPTSSQSAPADLDSGTSIPDRQAFTAGILAQVHGIQHEVRWLESRRRRDAFAMSMALAGYFLIAATTIFSAALLLS